MSNLNRNNINQVNTITWEENLYSGITVLKKNHIDEIETALDALEYGLAQHIANGGSDVHGDSSALAAGFLSKNNAASLTNVATLISEIEASLAKYSPSGIITAYDKPANQIQSGYVWCNGSNNTPDTRGKVILGMNGKEATKQEYELFKDGTFSDTIDGTEVTQKTVKATFQKKV